MRPTVEIRNKSKPGLIQNETGESITGNKAFFGSGLSCFHPNLYIVLIRTVCMDLQERKEELVRVRSQINLYLLFFLDNISLSTQFCFHSKQKYSSNLINHQS